MKMCLDVMRWYKILLLLRMETVVSILLMPIIKLLRVGGVGIVCRIEVKRGVVVVSLFGSSPPASNWNEGILSLGCVPVISQSIGRKGPALLILLFGIYGVGFAIRCNPILSR